MAKRLALACIALTCGACNAPKPIEKAPSNTALTASVPKDPMALSQEVLDKAKSATVLIGDFEDGKLSSTGSGVVSDDGLTIFTNRHVVVGSDDKVDPLKLIFFSGTSHPRLVKISPDSIKVFAGHFEKDDHYHEKDVALIHLKEKVVDPLQLGKSEEETETQAAWSLGFPHGTQIRLDAALPSPTVHSMRVERLEREEGAVRVIQLGGSPTFGDSGGPVLNSAGEIVGLMQAKELDGSSIVYAVPTKIIRDLMSDHDTSAKVASDWLKPLDDDKTSLKPSIPRPFQSGKSFLATRAVDEADLASLKPMELTALRNEPYARRGYIFQRDVLSRMFKSCKWYLPRTHDLASVQAALTPLEQRNVEFVREYQISHGKQW